MQANLNEYPELTSAEVRVRRRGEEENLQHSLLIFDTPFGYRRAAELFRPAGEGPFPLVLFIHWYEPSSPDSNRSQFVEEARILASRGALCMTVETMWSDPDYFSKRTQAEDLRLSIEEVVNLRRFMDFLAAQPGADPSRFALVGHDFGGMYAVLAGSLDHRPTHYVIMAATPRFPDWFLYAPPLEGEGREAFIREFAPLDPIARVAGLAPAPLLFQFGTEDPHVPRARAEAFFEAASAPKERRYYEAGHGLNAAAKLERLGWLGGRLGG